MLCCKIIKSQNNLKLKVRTEFPNVWGEYKYHGNPYIQGTTVPCDIPAECWPLSRAPCVDICTATEYREQEFGGKWKNID